MTMTATDDLPRGLNETLAEWYARQAVVRARRRALARGTLRATCVTCGATRAPESVPEWGAAVHCLACGARYGATLWTVSVPPSRVRRSEPGACTDGRCTTSESTTCRCACLGTQHGVDAS